MPFRKDAPFSLRIHSSESVASRQTQHFQTGIFRDTDSRTAIQLQPYSHIQPHNHSLLCAFFHIPVFHSDLRQVRGLQTEGCRPLSVILTFHLHRCTTILYTNIPITDSSGRKYADCGPTLPQHLPGTFKKLAAGVLLLPALFYRSVCYAHFFIFQYSTATYVKCAAYRLKAVDPCLLS